MDIHDVDLKIRDIYYHYDRHFNDLYTPLPDNITQSISSMHFVFNEHIQDCFIWEGNLDGTYTAKTSYKWLLNKNQGWSSTLEWSWIWKLPCPEKIKFLIWLAWHDSTPTVDNLQKRGMSASAFCQRCGKEPETFIHCIRDCED